MNAARLSAVVYGAFLVFSCSTEESSEPAARSETGPLSVYAVTYPIAYFAERIGGDMTQVHFPVPADVDPAHWSPSVEVIGEYQQADLILLSGAGYAAWTETSSLPRSRLIDTSTDFERPFIMRGAAVTHTHGPMGEHSHAEMASIVWLDLRQAVSQAERIAKILADRRPDHAAAFEGRLATLRAELWDIDTDLESTLEPLRDTKVLASHPHYEYFARRYRFEVSTVTWEPRQAPDEDLWAELEALQAKTGASWMIWDEEPLTETRAALGERGIEVVVVEPCANRSPDGDFLSVMRRNVDNLRAALGE